MPPIPAAEKLIKTVVTSGNGTPNNPYCIDGVNYVVSGNEESVKECFE